MEKTYYHILIETKDTGKKGDESEKYLELDRTNRKEIIDEIIIPFIKQEEFQFDGYFVDSDKIKRLVVNTSQRTTEELRKDKKMHRASNVVYAFTTKKNMFYYENFQGVLFAGLGCFTKNIKAVDRT